MKELEVPQNINSLTMYKVNDQGPAYGTNPEGGVESEYDNIDPFIFVKLDDEANKYWDGRSAPKDNVLELKQLELLHLKDPTITFLLEIITPRLPTQFYEKLPDRRRMKNNP